MGGDLATDRAHFDDPNEAPTPGRAVAFGDHLDRHGPSPLARHLLSSPQTGLPGLIVSPGKCQFGMKPPVRLA